MKKHNGIISLWKFLFAFMVAVYHGRVFEDGGHVFLSKGYIAVEFFFLTSGYLLAKTALSKKKETDDNLGKETIQYLIRKIKNFFPYILICFILTLIVKSIYENMTIKNYVLSIFELLFIDMAGFKGTSVNSIAWYISAMLISMIILYPLLRKYKYNYAYITAPLVVILIGGWLNYNSLTLTFPYLWMGFIYKGLIRAFFELNMGIVIFTISEKIKTINFTKLGKITITIIELVCYIIPFILYEFNIKTIYDYVLLLFLSIAIMFSFSEKTLEYKFLCNRFCYYLERLSLPFYLCQVAIRKLLINNNMFNNLKYISKLSIYLLIIFITSNILLFTVEKLRKKDFYLPKLMKIFVRD